MDEIINLQPEELKRREELKRKKKVLEDGMLMADKFINKNYLINLSSNSILPLEESEQSMRYLRLYKVEKIVFDRKENVNDKLISVYSALQNVGSSVLFILKGTPKETSMYIGVRSRENAPIAGKILQKSFLGNFSGSLLTSMEKEKIEELMGEMVGHPNQQKNVSCVTVVPSMRDKDKEKFVQGMEKFIDTMRGEQYTALFIGTPVLKTDLENRKRGYEELYSSLTPFLKITMSYAENNSYSISVAKTDSFSETTNRSISNTTGKNVGINQTKTEGSYGGFGFGGFNYGNNRSTSTGYSSGESWAKTIADSISKTKTAGIGITGTEVKGDTRTMTIEYQNKSVQILTEKLEKHLQRIAECESFGVWECAAYFIAEDVQTSVVAANAYKALVSGENTGVENSFINLWGIQDMDKTAKILEYMRYGLHPLIEVLGEGQYSSQLVTPANLISGKELPLIMGIPNKSVSGINVSSIAEFGRNVYIGASGYKGKRIRLGNIYHMGMEENIEIELELDSLPSHCLITGSTGCGKSNTTYCLLERMIDNRIPFLVIEPAKGEYRMEFGGLNGIHIFTTNPRHNRMLQINPFRFDENIHVLEHLDRLIEIFNACWEMYAAMPAILKDATEQMYLAKGWDLLNSVYVGEGIPQYPTFRDLLITLPKVINSSGYSADTKGDYVGALVTRVASLTNGIMGQVFCGRNDIDDNELFDENCIVDLSRVGSAETKSLLMGILIMKLSEYRTAHSAGQNLGLRHITVLEEAHNLLKKSSGTSENNLIGKSVEMISNSIAEMRTYGEGFVIVDQSPNALDISAIKNTNTKIIMRLPEQEDCKAVGNAVSLNKEQILELSKLETGIAVIMQNNWQEAVRGKIDCASGKYQKQLEEVSFTELKILRGQIIAELLRQYLARQMNEQSLQVIIQNTNVSLEKKLDYTKSVRKIVGVLERKRNSAVFADYLMAIAHCKNLFDILEEHLKGINFNKVTEDDELQIVSWYQTFMKKLDQYIVLKAGKKSLLTKYLIYSKLREDGTSKYIKIYNILFH